MITTVFSRLVLSRLVGFLYRAMTFCRHLIHASLCMYFVLENHWWHDSLCIIVFNMGMSSDSCHYLETCSHAHKGFHLCLLTVFPSPQDCKPFLYPWRALVRLGTHCLTILEGIPILQKLGKKGKIIIICYSILGIGMERRGICARSRACVNSNKCHVPHNMGHHWLVFPSCCGFNRFWHQDLLPLTQWLQER